MDGILTLYESRLPADFNPVSRQFRLFILQRVQRSPLEALKYELFPLHSPLLRESLLVSFPPLINMLKFSG